MSLENYLAASDAEFDAASKMVWSVAHTPGYHTRIADGSRVRSTRQAMDYVLANLMAGTPERAARACDIIDAICALQVVDPLAHHYGIWGWFYEEPPQQMNPADWNWADFIGARLAQALIIHDAQLRPATRRAARAALHHAAMSIFRRNVAISYTNIAVMGAVVSAATGELLDRPELLDYGRKRLSAVRTLTAKNEGFAEYNSPTYTRVALEEFERALMLVKDPALRADAEALRRIAWKVFADRFHPGTGQLAGPQARAYSDWLQPGLCDYLSHQTGHPVLPRPDSLSDRARTAAGELQSVTPLPCPPELATRFAKLPADPHVVVTRFSEDATGARIGTTWFTNDATLGSANRGVGWIQQRPLLGYWRTSEDTAVCLRARMIFNGRDLAASTLRCAQSAHRILAAWNLNFDSGSYHPHFDKPPGAIFEFTDLRMQIRLEGRGVRVATLPDGRFELSAGNRRAVIHPAPAIFCGSPLTWTTATTPNTASVEVALHAGPRHRLDFHEATLQLAFALELLAADKPASADAVTFAPASASELRWQWGDLSLLAPFQAERFGW